MVAAVLAKKSPTSRPTISRMTSSLVASRRGREEIHLPSRSTVMRSAMRKTSSRRWPMKRIATPWLRSAVTSLKSWSTSWAESEAVGSSMMSTRTLSEMARAISTACWAASVRPRAGMRTSSFTSNWARMASASLYIRPHRTTGPRSPWLMKMFSATLRSGKTMGSW